MSKQRRSDTGPELAIRRELHRRGLRFRVGLAPVKGLRRSADIAFTRVRVAVMVDGCFWHGCPEHGTAPKANATWWSKKLRANQERDLDTNRRMAEADWLVLRFWEHEDPIEVADSIVEAVTARRQTLTAGSSAGS